MPPENLEITPVWLGEIRAATEIGSLAACVRSNRRLRVAVEYALKARPPDRIRHRLERLRDRTDQESVGSAPSFATSPSFQPTPQRAHLPADRQYCRTALSRLGHSQGRQ